MSFEHDPRRQQELVGRPIADDIYRNTFGKDIVITRMERDGNLILDIQFAIDVKLTLFTGQILLGQEKFLSHEYARFQSVTVEHLQDWRSNDPGDWFKLAVQFYFVGYLTPRRDAFSLWIILNWANVVIATNERRVKWNDNTNKDGRARASFRWCKMSDFPQDCVIAAHSSLKKPLQLSAF